MTRTHRIAFMAALAVVAAAVALGVVGVSKLATSEQPARAVLAAHHTKVAAPTARRTEAAPTARETVIGFLSALKSGDYARACGTLLRAAGCEAQLNATHAGVSEYRLVGSHVSGAHATVDAVADGVAARFSLLRRSARWWIAALDMG